MFEDQAMIYREFTFLFIKNLLVKTVLLHITALHLFNDIWSYCAADGDYTGRQRAQSGDTV